MTKAWNYDELRSKIVNMWGERAWIIAYEKGCDNIIRRRSELGFQ